MQRCKASAEYIPVRDSQKSGIASVFRSIEADETTPQIYAPLC